MERKRKGNEAEDAAARMGNAMGGTIEGFRDESHEAEMADQGGDETDTA